MLEDCNYNKVKLLHDLSKIASFLERHAQKNAEEKGHPLCKEMYSELGTDIEKHIDKLRQAVEGVSKEGKF